MSSEETIRIDEFRLEDIPLSCTWIIVGPPGSGKTTFIENMAYYHKHRYPVARIFMGTEGGYKQFCNIFHPLYVSNSYDEDEERRHIIRQRTCIMNDPDNPGNSAINILDDVSDDPKIYKSKVMRGLFKLGSVAQHAFPTL